MAVLFEPPVLVRAVPALDATCPRSAAFRSVALPTSGDFVEVFRAFVLDVRSGVDPRVLAADDLFPADVRPTSPLLTFVRLLLFTFVVRLPTFTWLPTFTLFRLTLTVTLVRRGATTVRLGRYPGTGRTYGYRGRTGTTHAVRR